MRKNILRVGKRPFLNLSIRDKVLFDHSLLCFRDSFLNGAKFQAFRNMTDLILAQQSYLQDPVIFTHSCVMSGLGFSLYPLIDSFAQIVVKPDLQPYYKFVPWTFSTAFVSTTLSNTISQLFTNCVVDRENRPSFAEWSKQLVQGTASSGGFQIGMRLAHDLLPPPSKVGGVFAHSTAAMAMGDFMSSLCRAPFQKKTIRSVLTEFKNNLPAIIFDQAILTGMSYRTLKLLN